MCNNYASTRRELLESAFSVNAPGAVRPNETWPDYQAPIIRSTETGDREAVIASFGMVPKNRTLPHVPKFDSTNARSETTDEKRTFKGPWSNCQLALATMTSFYEPNYEHGKKSVRYRIWLKEKSVFAVARIWKALGNNHDSFSIGTVEAAHHPSMSRMHAPNKEKQSIVIIPSSQWDDWLSCDHPDAARSFLKLYAAGKLDTEPAPSVTKSANAESEDVST